VKLIIQIPCLNESKNLAATFADLPRNIAGISSIEVLVIDDGSTDNTFEVAQSIGVHHIVRFPQRRGLAAAHMSGLDACLRLGADIVVNTDADNQYVGKDIEKLIAPILTRSADIVIGDRQTHTIAHFSATKRFLQRFGSRIVRSASGTGVRDSTSGFRAMNRKALSTLFVHNAFTYTLETIIQAGNAGLAIENVTIGTNPKTRDSRLFSSISQYLRRNGGVILRSYGLYRPVRSFGLIAIFLLCVGSGLVFRFLYYYWLDPYTSSHVQSLQIGVGTIVLAFIVGLMALLSDLLATNRRLNEDILKRVRNVEAILSQEQIRKHRSLEGICTTSASPWAESPSSD